MSEMKNPQVRSLPRKRNTKRNGKRNGKRAPTLGRPAIQDLLTGSPGGFPQSILVRKELYYEYQLTVTSAAGIVGSYVFSANGMFDPNITGTGHQPQGFDDWMRIYDQYTVARSSIKVTFAGLTASTARVGLSLYDDTSITTDPSRLVEGGLMKMSVIGTGNGPQHTVTSLSLECDVPRYFGAPSFEVLKQNPSFVGTSAANPTEQVYFAVTLWGGFSTSSMTVTFDVVMSFDCFYYEPRHPASA